MKAEFIPGERVRGRSDLDEVPENIRGAMGTIVALESAEGTGVPEDQEAGAVPRYWVHFDREGSVHDVREDWLERPT